MLSFFKKFSAIFFIGSLLVSCSKSSLSNISVKANISRTSGEEIILKTILTNYSENDLKLKEIDISIPFNEALNLKRSDLTEGDCWLGTCTYYINRTISPGESIIINFNGNYIPSLISGEVDFYINNIFDNKKVYVECCK